MDNSTPTSDTDTLDGRITLRSSTRDRKPTMYIDPTFILDVDYVNLRVYLIHMKVHLFICVLCLYIEFWSYNRDFGPISEVHSHSLFY